MSQNTKPSLDHCIWEVHFSIIVHNINQDPSDSPSRIPWTLSIRDQLDQTAHELNLAICHIVNAYLPPSPTITPKPNPGPTPTHTKSQTETCTMPPQLPPTPMHPKPPLYDPPPYTIIAHWCLQRHHPPTSPPPGPQPHPPYRIQPPPYGPTVPP